MGDRISIKVPCDLRYRDAVGALIQQICSRLEHGSGEAGLGHQVVSAFNEAFNNVTQYAKAESPGTVEVELELRTDQLMIQIQDRGHSFAFDAVEPPDLDALPESGLGVFIIRSFMSDVSYTPGTEGQKNTLRMIRRLGPGADTPFARNET